MKSKIRWNLSGLLLVVLILMEGVIWAAFTKVDKEGLHTVIEETNSFSKLRIQEYEDYSTNDRVKSLVRLLDKTTELSSSMKKLGHYTKQDLDEYVEAQRLTGVLVLDENLNAVLQDTSGSAEESLWGEMLGEDYIKEILEHPEETYTERVSLGDDSYDVAVVPRQDAAGLVFAYEKKDKNITGDISLASVFADFPVSMNGIIVVSREDDIVSTNDASLLGHQASGLKATYEISTDRKNGWIVGRSAENKIWYGGKDKTGEYTIYVFFPSAQIFMTRYIACGLYTAAAILIYLLILLVQSNMERSALKQSQKRMRIINALGTAYSSIALFDLASGKVELIKQSAADDVVLESELYSKESQRKHIQETIKEEYCEQFEQFTDMETVAERLKGHRLLTDTIQMKNGLWLLSVLVPQRVDKDGTIAAVLLANRNVTTEKEKELKQEYALRNALAAAEHANKAKTNFLNSMSHDIRTPMNAVIGFTALASTHMDNKELVLEYLKKINISSRHLLSLINDVLDMSRIESGIVKLEEVKVHLPDVFHDLRSIIQGNISAKQQELYIDTQNVVHEDIITDKLRLNQVLLNIVSNAMKFTPVGGMINIRVSEHPCSRAGYASYTFSVRDNGVGMSPEFQEHIFDAFTREQTATRSGIQGTGLGMAISKNIVNMMGGTITVNSEAGKGSEFIVAIECQITSDTVKYKPVTELQGARALVVDDDANTCMSVCKMLRDIEMLADWTTSGKEAVLRAKEACEMKKEFKVYIIDWQMPDMNGIETVRRIRRVIGADTPIIILTAYDWSDIAEEAKEAGVTAFVSKPLFMSELRAALTHQTLDPDAEDEAETAEAARRYRHAGKKVLLVEDNILNQEIATAILEEAGLSVDVVEDGTDAVVRMGSADESQYDVILMDIQMPKMDGYTATKEIRTLSNNKKANIPIIAMTANAFEEDKKNAFEAGMNAHIAKPINIDVILEVFDQVFADQE